MTEEEKKACKDWEEKMMKPEDEGGSAIREAFDKELNEAFEAANVSANGVLSRDEFKQFVILMNNNGLAHGLKNRETTDEWVDMAYPSFNGYN